MPTVTPAELSRQLRTETSPDLARRRRAVALSLGGALIGGVVAAYQTGLLKRLPDILPGRVWDAEKVDASDYAYKRLQTPDGLLMILQYGLTAALAGAGGADRTRTNPAIPIAAAGKALFDLATTAKLAQEEWAENKALCSWCQVATALTALTVLATLPEAARAVRGHAAPA